jgi:ketosteroid isomerase-like protein
MPMKDGHPDARLVRELVQMLDQGDLDGVAARVADDVSWHFIGSRFPIEGKDALLRGLRAADDADWEIHADVHDVTVGASHVVALLRTRATRGGQVLEADTAEIYHVAAGKVTAHWAFAADTERILRFYGAPGPSRASDAMRDDHTPQ